MTDIGPPLDSRQIVYHPSLMDYLPGWILGVFLLYLSFRIWQSWKDKRSTNHPILLMIFSSVGCVSLITGPWLGILNQKVIGAYPTIDKEGSLLFYLDGVHWRLLNHPIVSMDDPAIQLIGLHLGHLWISEFFDIFLSTFGSFNAQMIFNLILNQISAMFLLKHFYEKQCQLMKEDWYKIIILSITLGLQLHVFRDINWYTIEKSAIYPLFFFWTYLDQLASNRKQGWWLPLLYFSAIFINFYWGLLLAILGFCYAIPLCKNAIQSKSIKMLYCNQMMRNLIFCTAIGMLFAVLQLYLMSSETPFASHHDFSKRAILDSFELFPPNWNRMGVILPINAIIIWFGFKYQNKNTLLIFIAFLYFLLSLGPKIDQFNNPVYQLFSWIPGVWRFAKPEIFFFITYAVFHIWTIQNSQKMNTQQSVKFFTGIVILHLLTLYISPAFPIITEFIPSKLHFKQ